MRALIDSDILVYRVGFSTQDKSEGIALARLESVIRSIQAELETPQYMCILSPEGRANFRYTVDPAYKANRTVPKPLHYVALRTHLMEVHNATIAVEEEADDLLGILQTDALLLGPEHETSIVSIDKDLNQIPGKHFNYIKGIHYEVEKVDGLRWFYEQLLIGDPVDNIKGVHGVGSIKARQFLKGTTEEKQMFKIVQELYHREFGGGWEGALRRNGRLLKIRTKRGELWELPT